MTLVLSDSVVACIAVMSEQIIVSGFCPQVSQPVIPPQTKLAGFLIRSLVICLICFLVSPYGVAACPLFLHAVVHALWIRKKDCRFDCVSQVIC